VAGYTIGIVGGGLMGHGIAYLLAAAGHEVRIFEPLAEVRATLAERLRGIVDLLGDEAVALDRITAHDHMAGAMHGVQFVFEAAPEKLTLNSRSSPSCRRWLSPTRSSPATVPPSRPPRSPASSSTASVPWGRISGTRRTWCRWSR
jgi:hypothetical protein